MGFQRTLGIGEEKKTVDVSQTHCYILLKTINCFILSTCGEPAISLHSHHVSLVQWTTRLLPVIRDLGSNPLGVLK
jgi:hypothetical protein